MTACSPTFRAALELFRDRAARHDEADPESEPYRLGLADAYADAAGVLEQLSGWPPQVAGDPDELPVRGVS